MKYKHTHFRTLLKITVEEWLELVNGYIIMSMRFAGRAP